ncbi:hypothetical protein IT41_00015 [Paracoccus halophilus]|uniref:Lipoprotein n=1 Tax=Paracoccus halophilus TaxID=376733 RepID=A0A099F8Q5_9RHOB|nr:hypothetical protein IT41_00015 [Paracoccus halophilus]
MLVLLGLLLLGACAAAPPDTRPDEKSTRLGTSWGEGLESNVSTVSLRRKSDTALSVQTLHYSAARGDGEVLREVQAADGRVGLRVLRENGTAWPIYRRDGVERLQGRSGERYTLQYRNYSRTRTYEIVATVDGLDVLSGRPGSLGNRGYVLRPGAIFQIKGFRKSSSEVAAFRFASVDDSYAANSAAGSRSNTGVIGTAVFELTAPAPSGQPRCGEAPCAFPENGDGPGSGYAPPPSYR